MEVCVVIPARLASTRLPRKLLTPLYGKPLLWYAWNQVRKAKGLGEPYIATDSDEIEEVASRWGGKVIMTSPHCRSGTERIASIVEILPGDFILNVQGDEPLIDPHLLENMVATWGKNGGDLITAVYPIREMSDLLDTNVVKVARGREGQALYFSRNPIPYVRGLPVDRWLESHTFWGHIGVYGYRREVLEQYPSLPASDLETAENLEQLRFLSAGFQIYTIEAGNSSIGVDTPADLERVRQLLLLK